MRIGIIALMHESNTFIASPTKLDDFKADLFLHGAEIEQKLKSSHHEIGGFFAGLAAAPPDLQIEVVPLVAFRATPAGVIEQATFLYLVDLIKSAISQAGTLDGLLVAIHGAAVADGYSDADGHWLTELRNMVGEGMPIVGTLDPHANLSVKMVRACNALVAYRTNPHLDQRQRGEEAARILMEMLSGTVRPTMAASFPPLVMNIERQCTSEEHLARVMAYADEQRNNPQVITNSVLFGFPYADVKEMGVGVIVVTDNDQALAQNMANDIAQHIWRSRRDFEGKLVEVQDALEEVKRNPQKRYCLLDMGDNVGGGSAADGTIIAEQLLKHFSGPSLVCIYDPDVVQQCVKSGIGNEFQCDIGGKVDGNHGPSLHLTVNVVSLHDGKFKESQPRHGGIVDFDQGTSVVLKVKDQPLKILVTSKRMVPFSLEQIRSCGLNPEDFQILVAKGVHAPLAAYREVCDEFIRVNTPGSTCADLAKLVFRNRRRPLYPFDACEWSR